MPTRAGIRKRRKPMNLTTVNPRLIRLLWLATLVWAGGGCSTQMASGPDIDPAAREQISRMQSAVEQLDAYQITFSTLSDEKLPSGQFVQEGQTAVLRVARPDRLAIRAERDSGEKWAAWLSGGKLVLLDETRGLYARLDLPAPLDQALDALSDRYGLELPLIDIVSGLRRAGLLDRVQTGIVLGTEPVAGKECHHLLFRQPVVDWQIWIEQKDPALPRQILFTFKDEPNHPVHRTTFTEWNILPGFKDSEWEPQLPEKASEVDIAELLSQEKAS
jgi:hypothetical protein